MRAIDPLAPARGGVYRDGVVEVRWSGRTVDPVAVSDPAELFDVIPASTTGCNHRGPTVVAHHLDPTAIDVGVGLWLYDGLFAHGPLVGLDVFERVFTGIIVSSASDPLVAWERFYRRSLAEPGPVGAKRIDRHHRAGHRWVVDSLVGDSVLEVGCNFGLLSLLMAADARPVTAVDLVVGSVRLLSAMADRLGLPVSALAADGARLPVGNGAFDTVVAVHLLEHLDHGVGDAVVAETVRVAARRVIVVVPLEDRPNATWGHVRTVTMADLARWGCRSRRWWVGEAGGEGRLIIDR